MAKVEENPQTPLRLSVPPITIPCDEAAGEFSQASSSHPFETEASPSPRPKKPLTPEELILSEAANIEAANISSQPLHTSDTAVWGALTALSVVIAPSTNGTYLNWEKLKKTSSDAKLRHGDIISFAAPPQHELAVAYRKAEELGSKNKRVKGTGIGASESPISRYELQSCQQSNMISKEPMKRLEGQVLTADSFCIENREAVAHHESDDASTQGSKADSECVVDYSTEFTTQEIFKSRESLIQWACEVGRRNGFVVVIKTSDAVMATMVSVTLDLVSPLPLVEERRRSFLPEPSWPTRRG
ncbi:hypothetical protein Vadar_018664 [Vaccinium darrowii]|uniref:Uncharacterized protein n=1 Tax=Vaccinium darrowii TaxID=229202 RepID=A0ACB7Y872_9ERIC|nr:hypothetical protein Vadar_018664 [Vaccinium darrowii]